MVEATRRRGARDTGRVGPGLAAGSRRLFVVCALVSLFLHAPLIPNALFRWLGIVLDARDIAANDVDGEAIIPIDLDLELHGGAAEPAPSNATPPSSDPGSAGEADAAPPPKPKPRPKPAPDAGDDAATDGPSDAPSGDGGDASPPPVASAEPDAGDAAPPEIAVVTPPQDAGAPPAKLKDPVGAAGDPSRIAGKDPNVQVLLAGDRLRSHALGATFSGLLTALPEWAEFFDGTGVDPIKDFDHVLLAGPQFKDFRKVVAVMDYNCPEKKARDAMATIVLRTKGSWLEGAPVAAIQFTLARDQGERILAIVPQKHLLVLLPKEAKEQLVNLKTTKPFAKSSVGILLSMVTPSRAFRGLPVAIPESLKWLRLSVTPQPNGEADVDLEALDASAAEAARHAPELTRAIEGIRRVDLGLFAIEVIDHTELVAQGDLIRGHVHVTRKQLGFVMDEVNVIFAKKAKDK